MVHKGVVGVRYLQGHAVGYSEDGSSVGGVVSTEEGGGVVVPRASHVTVRVDKGVDRAWSRRGMRGGERGGK